MKSRNFAAAAGGHLRPPRLPIGGAELEKAIQEVLKLKIPGLPAWASPR
jgi:hypothetical protein